jgi:hypothetical protein
MDAASPDGDTVTVSQQTCHACGTWLTACERCHRYRAIMTQVRNLSQHYQWWCTGCRDQFATGPPWRERRDTRRTQ